jgi:hypothetical protein
MIVITHCRICYMGQALLMERLEIKRDGRKSRILDFKPIDNSKRRMYSV